MLREANRMNGWFPVKVGQCQGCVTTPWLFNIHMDGVVRKVNAKLLGRGLSLMRDDGRQ